MGPRAASNFPRVQRPRPRPVPRHAARDFRLPHHRRTGSALSRRTTTLPRFDHCSMGHPTPFGRPVHHRDGELGSSPSPRFREPSATRCVSSTVYARYFCTGHRIVAMSSTKSSTITSRGRASRLRAERHELREKRFDDRVGRQFWLSQPSSSVPDLLALTSRKPQESGVRPREEELARLALGTAGGPRSQDFAERSAFVQARPPRLETGATSLAFRGRSRGTNWEGPCVHAGCRPVVRDLQHARWTSVPPQ
jgi:hypothetical protein